MSGAGDVCAIVVDQSASDSRSMPTCMTVDQNVTVFRQRHAPVLQAPRCGCRRCPAVKPRPAELGSCRRCVGDGNGSRRGPVYLEASVPRSIRARTPVRLGIPTTNDVQDPARSGASAVKFPPTNVVFGIVKLTIETKTTSRVGSKNVVETSPSRRIVTVPRPSQIANATASILDSSPCPSTV